MLFRLACPEKFEFSLSGVGVLCIIQLCYGQLYSITIVLYLKLFVNYFLITSKDIHMNFNCECRVTMSELFDTNDIL